MKIGLVLFGHLRSYRQTLSSFNFLKETLQRCGEVDIFCHTWDIEESVTASWWKEHKPGDAPPATVQASEIEKLYSPAKYAIESSRQFDDSGYNVRASFPVAGILSMLHSQQRSFELLKDYEKENQLQYDVVVKTRYDLLYEVADDFRDIVNRSAAEDIVYLPSSNPYELLGSSSDIFVAGGRDETEKYFSFCTRFEEALTYYNSRGYRRLIPELCMTVYLDKIGVKRGELSGLRLHIQRMSGEKFQVNSDQDFENNAPLCFYRNTIELCTEILPAGSAVIEENSNRLVRKYMGWIDKQADEKELHDYEALYKGKWIEEKKIKTLAKKGKGNRVFSANVMKNFFEESVRNAKYGMIKLFRLTVILYRYSGYGFFFFRVLKKKLIHAADAI